MAVLNAPGPKEQSTWPLPVGPKLDLKPLPVTWSFGEILAEVRFLGMGDTSSGAQAFGSVLRNYS